MVKGLTQVGDMVWVDMVKGLTQVGDMVVTRHGEGSLHTYGEGSVTMI